MHEAHRCATLNAIDQYLREAMYLGVSQSGQLPDGIQITLTAVHRVLSGDRDGSRLRRHNAPLTRADGEAVARRSPHQRRFISCCDAQSTAATGHGPPCRPQPGAAGLPPEAVVLDENRRDWVGQNRAPSPLPATLAIGVVFSKKLPTGRAVARQLAAAIPSAGNLQIAAIRS
jgi:hypothetical protein